MPGVVLEQPSLMLVIDLCLSTFEVIATVIGRLTVTTRCSGTPMTSSQ